MDDAVPEPALDFRGFKNLDLKAELKLHPPPFAPRDVYRQLEYVQAYAADLGCKCIVIERHYIDRDHIEDHSIFYSKSLRRYSNFCQRVHFFALESDELQAELERILVSDAAKGESEYRHACRQFSDRAYLGFSVIKPLDGTPVGRTVMKCFGKTPDDAKKAAEYRRFFGCTRRYTAHVRGVELQVDGLAFQQQDIGVSACATTALWSALQSFRNHEELATATPAQITTLAVRYSLPFGRAMPSEGLSLDQMCQAVQALGVSPNVFRVEEDYALAKSILFSAVQSGICPILILKRGGHSRHAVAVSGSKVKVQRKGALVATGQPGQSFDVWDFADDLIGLYIHDDRYGPYLSASIIPKGNVPELSVRLRDKNASEVWQVSHILLPMHGKVRLSFSALRQIAVDVAQKAVAAGKKISAVVPTLKFDPSVHFDLEILRSHKYVERLVIGRSADEIDRAKQLTVKIAMARYVGVIHLEAAFFDQLDLIVDTTNTLKNAHCLAVVARGNKNPLTPRIAHHLSGLLQCSSIV